MVDICGSDIPNLSKIVDDVFDSLEIYHEEIDCFDTDDYSDESLEV